MNLRAGSRRPGTSDDRLRGEPLDEVIERFTELCGRSMDLAGGLNGTLSKAHSVVGYLAYKETPDEQEQAARRTRLRPSVRQRAEADAGAFPGQLSLVDLASE